MHEMSIAKNLVKITCEACEKNNIRIVKTVNLRAGELKAIVPGLLEDAFKYFAKGTVCDKAKLRVKVLPVKFSCVECKVEVKRSNDIKCGKCGRSNVEMTQGKEFIIESVEGK